MHFLRLRANPPFFNMKSFVSILDFSGFGFGAFLSTTSSYWLKLVWKLLWEVWIFATLKWDTTWRLNLHNMEKRDDVKRVCSSCIIQRKAVCTVRCLLRLRVGFIRCHYKERWSRANGCNRGHFCTSCLLLFLLWQSNLGSFSENNPSSRCSHCLSDCPEKTHLVCEGGPEAE